MTVNKITNAPTQNEIINSINDLIDNKQDTLIAGTDLEIIPAQAPILPEGFTQIEYIEGTGTQYIDTGFYGTQNSGAYIRFALTDLTSEGSARVFGTRIGTAGTKAFAFISSYDGSSLPSDKFYIGSNGYASWPTNLDTNWHEVSCNIENDKKVYFDGNLIITGGNTAYTSTAQASIFRRYNQNTYSGKSATAKISILQIYENAVMVHNFIPCRRDSDDELGMYDLVSDTFFTNSGTGTFIAGPDTVFPETDLINFTNESGYIKGIDSTDVITALGYTPYDSANPDNYTTNVGTVTSVNNIEPDENGNVTIQTGGATDVQINGTSITSDGVANILTQTAYNAISNKIATMSDLPADEIFVAEYNVTTYQQVLDAYNAGKTIFEKYTDGDDIIYLPLVKTSYSSNIRGFAFATFANIAVSHKVYQNGLTVNGWNTMSWRYVIYCSGVPMGSTLNPVYVNNYGAITSSYSTVGSSTTPVYMSSGTITSTGLSIASSRFDGQWVQSYHGSLVTATSAGSSQASISTYLPSDSYDYEVMFYLAANYGSSAGDVAIGNTASPLSNNCIRIKGRVRNTSASVHCTGIIPIKSSARIIYTQREVKVSAFQVDMIAYRRIGTNT